MRGVSAAFIALVFTSTALAQEAIPGALQPGQEGILGELLAPEPGKRICYARSYSADHLKAHPKQKVTEMRFRLTYFEHERSEDLPDGQRNYYFELAAKRRGEGKLLRSLGECLPNKDSISCFVECDGGGVRVHQRDDNRVLINFGDYGRIRMAESCGEEEPDEAAGVDLEPGADDKEFLLSKLPDAECPAYDSW